MKVIYCNIWCYHMDLKRSSRCHRLPQVSENAHHFHLKDKMIEVFIDSIHSIFAAECSFCYRLDFTFKSHKIWITIHFSNSLSSLSLYLVLFLSLFLSFFYIRSNVEVTHQFSQPCSDFCLNCFLYLLNLYVCVICFRHLFQTEFQNLFGETVREQTLTQFIQYFNTVSQMRNLEFYK